MERLVSFVLLALAAPLLALKGLALAQWLQPLTASALVATLAAASITLLRIALEASAASSTVDRLGTARGALSILGVLALMPLVEPALPDLLPAASPSMHPLPPALALAVAAETVCRAATVLAVRSLLPALRREWLLQQLCRQREAGTVAAIVGHGLEQEALLQRARHELDQALARIERQVESQPHAATRRHSAAN